MARRITMLLPGILLVAALACRSNGVKNDTTVNPSGDSLTRARILATMETIEKPKFFSGTLIAPGHGVVRDVLMRTPELRFLIEQRAISCAMVGERAREYKGDRDQAPIAYFIALEEGKCIDAIPDIIAYLRALPDDADVATLLSPWHPFVYGMRACETLTGGEVRAGSGEEMVRGRGRFLEEVERWDRERG